MAENNINISNDFDEFMEDSLKEFQKDDEIYGFTKDEINSSKRVDSRNSGIKVSKQLEEKLGQYHTNGIKILVNFDELIKKQLELSSCTPEMRSIISLKMVRLSDLLAKIYKITKSHASNDEKKEKLIKLLDGISVIELCGKISEEIEATRKVLISKAKNIAKEVKSETLLTSHEISSISETDNKEVDKPKDASSKKESNPKNKTKSPQDVKVQNTNPKTTIFNLGARAMEKVRYILNEVIEDKSDREVTPNIIENILNRISDFSQDKKIGDLCKGISKDVFNFANVVTYNVGDYIVHGAKRGIARLKSTKNSKVTER